MSINTEHVELDQDLHLIVERLEIRFHAVDSRIVTAVVRQCAALFEHARVKAYVSVLTEKMAKDRLEHLDIMTAPETSSPGRPRDQTVRRSPRDAGVSSWAGRNGMCIPTDSASGSPDVRALLPRMAPQE